MSDKTAAPDDSVAGNTEVGHAEADPIGAASSAATHEEKLRAEERRCPQCGYAILNPLTDRCPRCFSPVARVETNCGSCTWQGNCEFAHLANAAKKRRT